MVFLGLVILATCGVPTPLSFLDQKVTLDVPGWTVKKTLETLSQKTGLKFVASDEIGNDHVIVHVKDVTVADFMKHLADVEYGEWFKNRDQYDFQIDSAKYKAWIVKSNLKVATRLRSGINARSKSSPLLFNAEALAVQLKHDIEHPDPRISLPGQKLDHLTAETFALRKNSMALPITRAMLEILPKLPVDEIAETNFGERIVFSNHPTSLQYGLPESCKPIFEKLQKDQDAFVAVCSSLDLEDPGFAPGFDVVPPDKPIDDSGYFNLSIVNNDTIFDVEACAFDSKGDLVGKTSMQIDGYEDDPSPKISPANIEIAIPESAQVYAKIMRGTMFGLQPNLSKLITPEIHRVLLHPELYYPASLVGDPCLASLAKTESLNVICSAETIGLLLLDSQNAKTFNASIFDISSDKTWFKTVRSEGWLEISDDSPLLKSILRINCDSFGNLLRNGIIDGVVDPAAFAKYAAESSSDSYSNFIPSNYLLALCGPNGSYEFQKMTQLEWLQLQLVGSLDPRQLSEALSSKGLPTGELSKQQMGFVSESVFNGFSLRPPIAQNQQGEILAKAILGEPTVAFVNGIPPSAHIQVSDNPKDILLVPFDNGSTDSSLAELSPKDFAKLLRSPQAKFNLNSVTYEREQFLQYSLTFPPAFEAFNQSKEWMEPSGKVQVKDWHNLPTSVVKQIQDVLDNPPQ